MYFEKKNFEEKLVIPEVSESLLSVSSFLSNAMQCNQTRRKVADGATFEYCKLLLALPHSSACVECSIR